MELRPIALADRDFILSHLADFVPDHLNRENLLLTGATGFFGKWLIQTLLAAEDRWQLGNRLTIVSRDPTRVLNELPFLKNRTEIEWCKSDIRELELPGKSFSTIIHGAAAASRDLNENRPDVMFNTLVEGNKRVLEIAETSSCRRLLFISSGAIYGAQPGSVTHVSETDRGGPDPLHPKSAYGEAKRASEFLCSIAARRAGFELKVARCFAFFGPYLPLDSHFAAGNFIGDVLKAQDLKIGGDGSALRSYLYAADLMVWLMKILISGKDQVAYNVGSGDAISIADLANTVHKVGCRFDPKRASRGCKVSIAKTVNPKAVPERYVPSIERARTELGLKVWTDLETSILKTLQWHSDQEPIRL
jgi:dTDP-glucose 4,6-dehydratase